jgi:hypothetical protein
LGDSIPKEPDLFHFLQCATVASPGDKKWGLRIKEEKYALVKLIEYIEYWEKIGDNPRWFSIKPVNEDATRWAGTVTCQNYQFDIELVLKKTYPHTPPAARVPVLIDYTDRKLEDEVLGLRICDMHMEQNFWWNEHCSIALYLKREVSYWVQSVLTLAIRQGYL